MDGARGLVDFDWSQRMPIFQSDDIDCDPRFTQYPFQEGDDFDDDDDEEEMEVEGRLSGGAGDASMAPPTNTQRLPAMYSFESAHTLGLPWSTHTDTDTAMEMGGLSMASGGPDLRRVTPRGSTPPVTQRAMSMPDLATTVAGGVAATATEILERFTQPPQVNEADRPPINLAADAAIRERFQRRLAATPPATTSRTSAFDWLGHRTPAPKKEGKWAPHPEMTPHRIDCGPQPQQKQEAKQAVSQKRQSQSWPCDEDDPQKGRTDGEGKSGKIQVGINWSTTGIQKPILKPDSCPRPPNLMHLNPA